MTEEQQIQLDAIRTSLPGMSLEQLFAEFHAARLGKAEAGAEAAAYWRAVLLALGNQLHRRLGPGALQEYARRYVETS